MDSYPRALRLLEAIRYQIDQHRFDPSNYIKTKLRAYQFNHYVAIWLRGYERRWKQKRLSPAYLKEVKRFAERYYLPYFGAMDIREVSSVDIKNFADNLPQNLSLGYQRNILVVLRKLFGDALNDGYIEVLPKFPSIEVPEKFREWVGEETQDAILEAILDYDKPIIMFMMRQAVRPGEARALQWHDIDFERDFVVIRRAYSLNECREFTKKKNIRIIPLDPDVKEMLQSLPVPFKKKDFVFKYRGKPYSQRRLNWIWNRAVKELELEDITLYGGTRHSVASQAANRGVDFRIIGKLLGHKDPKVTARYAQLQIRTLRAALRSGRRNRPQSVRGDYSAGAKVLKFEDK